MMHLGWFLTTGFGVYGWRQQWSGNSERDIGRPDLFVDTARSLERAGFDYLMLEDSSVLPGVFRGTYERSVRTGTAIRFDPMPLVPLLAAATEHIGIIATAATSFYPPFLAARLMTTLDHLTNGRVGINLVTASADGAAQNYGLDKHIEHDLRYRMAADWVEAVTALWESWSPDAVGVGTDRAELADHTEIIAPEYVGEFHRTKGPLNLPPGPQRRPVICQAGGSEAGRQFGATYADTVIVNVPGVEAMREYRDDIRERAAKAGRNPDHVKVLYLVSPILAETDEEAFAKQRRAQEELEENFEGVLAGMSYFSGIDFSKFDVDTALPELREINGHKSTMEMMLKSGTTLREIATNSRNSASIHLVGTPESVADQMAEAHEAIGGDGFLIASPVTRRNVIDIADGLAPALRRRGLIRDGYEHATFRENLLAY